MNSNLLWLALVATPLLGAAQVTDLTRDKGSNLNNGYTMAPAETLGVQGTPYLLPYWAPATLLLRGGQPLATALKYDLYRQELRAKRPPGDSVVVPLAQVREFSLTATGAARRFVCYPAASLPAEVHGGCAEALYDGPHAQLLKFQWKELVKQAGDASSYASAGTAVSALADRLAYYLRWPADGRLVPLRLKRASLEQALAGQPAALAALKARKGSLGTEADLAAAVAAIDPLLTGK